MEKCYEGVRKWDRWINLCSPRKPLSAMNERIIVIRLPDYLWEKVSKILMEQFFMKEL